MLMPDGIPPQAWIVLALVVTAWAPASYVWHHLTHSSRPRDITLPPEDLEWKSDAALFRSLTVLLGLAAMAVFVFTPQAEAFARSDWFAPVILGAIGGLALNTLYPGWRKGEIEPLVRGPAQSYSRAEQPKRFWLSLVWNGVLGAILTAASLGIIYANVTPECDDDGDAVELQGSLEACNARLSEVGLGRGDRAELLGDRGRVYHRLGDDARALADYSAALEIDPGDSYALYNRGLIRKYLGNYEGAISDFSASLKLRPDNDDAYLERGLAYLDTARFAESIADFTQLHARDPEHPYALANRGVAHAWLGNVSKAEADFSGYRDDEEAWLVVLHGRAILAMDREDYGSAIRYLSQALKLDPNDGFALKRRADAYWEIGKFDLARDDDDRLTEIEEDLARSHLTPD